MDFALERTSHSLQIALKFMEKGTTDGKSSFIDVLWVPGRQQGQANAPEVKFKLRTGKRQWSSSAAMSFAPKTEYFVAGTLTGEISVFCLESAMEIRRLICSGPIVALDWIEYSKEIYSSDDLSQLVYMREGDKHLRTFLLQQDRNFHPCSKHKTPLSCFLLLLMSFLI